MSVTTTTHLNFRGDAREALKFYQSVFGGDLTVVTYAQANAVQNPDEADQVTFGQVVAENGFSVMGYDVPSSLPWERGTNSFFVSVRGDSADELTDLWAKLLDGSTVVVDLGPSGWAPLYGMVADRFGVVWVLDLAVAYTAE